MKNNRLIRVIIPIAGILIAAVIAAAVLLISSQKKDERYSEQMRAVKKYMEEADYSKVIEAYESAIQLKPDEPEAYIGLAEYYLEQKQYYEAEETARRGKEKTGSSRLDRVIDLIEASRAEDFQSGGHQDTMIEAENREGKDSINLLLRNNMVGTIQDYCYQQYVNEYGDPKITYVSAEEGYKVKFRSLNVYAYFKNTPENKNAVDSYAKKPLPNAKPYKVEVVNPQLLFVGYEGYISSARIGEIFNIQPVSYLQQIDDKYYLLFDYMGCSMKIETDAQGNVCQDTPVIELCPKNLVSDWEEEPEVEEEEEEDPGTFVLAGETYTYDVKEIYIYDAHLDDLSPLSQCKDLRTIMFIRCQIDDLSPLSGCSALRELNLQGSSGNMDLSCLSGLSDLRYLEFHECRDIDDISGIMDLDLELLHPCGSSVSFDQCAEYQNRHPGCEVWFDYYVITYFMN